MEKRLKIEDFADVDGESFTFAERLEELGEELTTKDIWIMDGQKFKNTKEGRRLLENYALSTYGGRSYKDAIYFGFYAILTAVMIYLAFTTNSENGLGFLNWLFGIITIVGTVILTVACVLSLMRN